MKAAHRAASAYKRRWAADPTSLYKVMNKIEPFTEDEQIRLTTPGRLAFEKLRTGAADEPDFHLLAACINVTMVLSEKIDPLAEQTALAARDAMVRCWERYQRTGRLGFDGPALLDIPVAIDLHDQAMGLLTPLQVSQAVQEVIARKDGGQTVGDMG